jgi:hypothetical protein
LRLLQLGVERVAVRVQHRGHPPGKPDRSLCVVDNAQPAVELLRPIDGSGASSAENLVAAFTPQSGNGTAYLFTAAAQHKRPDLPRSAHAQSNWRSSALKPIPAPDVAVN